MVKNWIIVVHDIYMIEKLTFILRQEKERKGKGVMFKSWDPGLTMYYHLEKILPLSTC